MLPLDRHDHGEVAGRVPLDDPQLGLAGPEAALHRLDTLGRCVEAVRRLAAGR